ncbi:FxsA family protein [Luteolibacter marinus]|uniref:FxsA family protein n=1 Tax=Luteolibacter marinus TaxID=2776705 RepID=UPI001867FDC4|nr:FxsA family protein [Luteolibacter marinus]
MLGRLFLLFITVPLIELALFLTVGEWIGLPTTLAIVILTGLLGAWLTKSQGLRVLQAYRQSMAAGRLPHQEVLEGLLILVAGAVLLTPGFLTDAIGFLLLTPPVRAVAVKRLMHALKSRIHLVVPGMNRPDSRGEPPGVQQAGKGDVIDVEVVED